ncbi:MAG: RibD family protein [Brevundimonas sp.]|jgi:diaminohydroxyphosphoribosylaminopyrimidine deaminase / 5-amino-6-(5-phosphoribosylamino)uracil reductase|uniref:RibD family protein n=1 Tax=Brevundimonas sp. TaxID=1871086 RepID=UPI0039199C86
MNALTITLKLATSLDGRIATARGESQWITGEAAREQGHRLRAEHDAIMVGVGTVLADDPRLDCRLPGYSGPQPLRIVMDSALRTPPGARLLGPGSLILTTSAGPAHHLDAEVVKVPADPSGRVDAQAVARHLSGRGLKRLLIEGGGAVAASFLRAGLIDRIEWFRAPVVIGEEGLAGIGALAVSALGDAPRFDRLDVQPLGPDLWERYERAASKGRA